MTSDDGRELDGREFDERELAAGLTAGEPAAWNAFYDAFAETVWSWTARRLGSSSDVGDVVQEVFLAAARSAHQFDGQRGSLAMWLQGIARNQIALHFRKQSRSGLSRLAAAFQSAGDGRLSRWLDGDCDSPLQTLERLELAALVRQVLSRMPEDYATLLTAKYLDDVPVDELAVAQGTTPVALRSKLARARAAFRETLAGMSDEILEAVRGANSAVRQPEPLV